MDPVLSSLFPVNQIGSDGFSWWIGQIESEKGADPKNSGRYRVRIVGVHLKDCDATPTESLPWAQVMMPVTSPFTDGGTTGATVDLRQGNWVVGFYVDNDRQKPIIMGSIGHTAGATQKSNVESDPNPGSTCKSFTTYIDDTSNPNLAKPMASDEKRNGDQPAAATTAETNGTTKPGEAGQTASSVPNQMPAAFYGLFAEASTTNPTGNKVCVEIANPNCGSENDLQGGLTKIIGDMLKATQQSGGNLGTYYVSKINGELNSYIDHGMEYVNKAVLLVKSFVARVKGEIVKLIREGVDQLVELILYEKVVEETAEKAAEKAEESQIDKEAENPEEPATKKESRLKPIFDTINDVLDDLGCSMADLTDRLAQWLTDLLLGYLMDAYSNAVCLVDNVVNGILDQILSFLDELISSVLGPIQEILSLLAAPLDIIGNAINKVLSLLGISCDGPPAQCEKVKKECVDCGTDEKNEDWLDDLIAALTDGALDNTTYVCDEAKNTSALDSLPPTDVVFIGGTQPTGEEDPIENTVPADIFITYSSEDIEVTEGQQAVFTITRGGAINTASSLTMTVLGGTATQGVDYDKIFTGSSIGFAPGQSTKKIVFETYKDNEFEGPETFFIKLEENVTPQGYFVTYPGGNVHKCTINDFISGVSNSQQPELPPNTPFIPPSKVAVDSVQVGGIIGPSQPALPVFSVTTEKLYYSEGETIVYNITTKNVPFDGTTYTYTIDGDVTADDLGTNSLTGNFQLDSNGEAVVSIPLVANDDAPIITDEDGNVVDDGVDPAESIVFSIDDTPAFVTNYILADDDTDNVNALWSVTSDLSYVSEGETVTFTITTKNVPDGTNFTYKLVGDITATDIVGYKLESNKDFNNLPLKIVNGTCVVPITIALDGETETNEYFNFVVDFYVDEQGNQQEVGVQTQVILLGESDPVVLDTQPSYFVSSDKLEYKEGETIVFTLTTTNIADGTKLGYTLYGSGISKNDFVNESLFGSFVVINNTAKIYITIKEDTEVEEIEQVTLLITGTGASASVFIVDTSPAGQQKPDPEKKKPCFDKPVAGKPITDGNGSIISIPVVDSGCPYIFPPKVIITGPGFGATAIALLDANNKVSEIRVTRSGKGYNINKPDDFGLRCVIDSYTLIKPGTGYTSTPEVYVDGVAGRAEAVIDDRGYVISVRPTDRTTTWNEIPQVRIIGGGGSGARVIPSVVCLDNNEYENQGYAKIGTGRYVDCP